MRIYFNLRDIDFLNENKQMTVSPAQIFSITYEILKT